MKRSQKTLNPLKSGYLSCKAYLFDLDHTLLLSNSSFRFGWYLYQNKVVSFFKMFYLLACYGMHLLGRLSINSLHLKTMRVFFQGRTFAELDQWVQAFLDQHLDSMQNESILSILRTGQREGKFVAILSGSPDFLVGAIAQRWGVESFLGTEYCVSPEGVISGLAQAIQGEEKAEYVRNLHFDRKEIAGFSDSIHDLTFLQAVGYPVAVNPDRRLTKNSAQTGWQVVKTGPIIEEKRACRDSAQ